MKKNVRWRFLFIGFTVLIAVIFFLPNTPLFKYMPEWWQKNMPGKGIILGLDLQGGLHLVFEVEGDKAVDFQHRIWRFRPGYEKYNQHKLSNFRYRLIWRDPRP
jgi:preprotein translocase subunit SecD